MPIKSAFYICDKLTSVYYESITLIEKKKKLYALIAWISWCLPIVICGSIAIYGFINKETIKGNIWWGIFFIAIPLIVGCIFDLKSKRY